MEGFNNKLEVGQLALIIGTAKPENSYLIGTTVKVECFWHEGQEVTEFYQNAKEAGWTILVPADHRAQVVVSGCGYTGKTSNGQFSMKDGWTNFRGQYLMPLPPLPEEELAKDKELELS